MYLQSDSSFQQGFPPALRRINHRKGGSSAQVLELTKKSKPNFRSFGIGKPSLKQNFVHISPMFINGLIRKISVCTVPCVSEC